MSRRITTIALGQAILIAAAALTGTPKAIPVHAGGRAAPHQSTPYIVTYRARGVRISLRFASHSFPRDALIAVTDTVTNLSHRHLATTQPFNPAAYPCSPPMVSLESVNAQGQDAAPLPPVPFPAPGCPVPPLNELPIGKSRVERQLIVLWTPRLTVTAGLANFVRTSGTSSSVSGFALRGPTIRFHVRRRSPAKVTIAPDGSRARIIPPPGATGQYYWEGWGACTSAPYSGLYWPLYWTPRRSRTIVALCSSPQKWYLAVGWLNHSVTSVVYPSSGASPIGQRSTKA